MLKSWKSTICRSFLAAAIVVAGPVLGIAGLAGSASAVPVKGAGPAPALPPAALGGISCTSATFCMAVGGASATMSTQVAAEDWTGSAWHRLPIPKPGGVSNVGLSAVSCPSATECVAIGAGTNKSSKNWMPVAETWTHSGGWKTGKPVVPAGNGFSALSAISCPSTSLCYAAGVADAGTVVADQLPLVERWTPNGGWTRVTLPVLRGSSGNALSGISCKSATQCAAVGVYSTSTTQHGLIEQLKGTTWTAGTAPKSTNGSLNAVSCPSTALCVAVGQLPNGHNLAERWSGGTWTATTPPAPAGSGSASWLDGVSCASTTHCVAIGGTLFSNGSGAAFVDTLSGTTWTKTAQSGSAFKVGELNAVSCFPTTTRATSCALLGATTPISATQRPLSAFLTGSTWHVVFTV